MTTAELVQAFTDAMSAHDAEARELLATIDEALARLHALLDHAESL